MAAADKDRTSNASTKSSLASLPEGLSLKERPAFLVGKYAVLIALQFNNAFGFTRRRKRVHFYSLLLTNSSNIYLRRNVTHNAPVAILAQLLERRINANINGQKDCSRSFLRRISQPKSQRNPY